MVVAVRKTVPGALVVMEAEVKVVARTAVVVTLQLIEAPAVEAGV